MNFFALSFILRKVYAKWSVFIGKSIIFIPDLCASESVAKYFIERIGFSDFICNFVGENKMQPSLDTLVRISELLDIGIKGLIISNKA